MLWALLSWFTGGERKTARSKPGQISGSQGQVRAGHSRPGSVTEELAWLDEPTEVDMERFGEQCKPGTLIGTDIVYYGVSEGGDPDEQRREIMFGDEDGPLGRISCVHLADERNPWECNGKIGGRFVWREREGGLIWEEVDLDGSVRRLVPINKRQILLYKGLPMVMVWPDHEDPLVPFRTFNVVFAANVYYELMISSWRNTRGFHTWRQALEEGLHRPLDYRSPVVDRRAAVAEANRLRSELHAAETVSDLRPAKKPRADARVSERRPPARVPESVESRPVTRPKGIIDHRSRPPGPAPKSTAPPRAPQSAPAQRRKR